MNGLKNNKGGLRKVYSTEKSTSASRSVLSSPPLEAAKTPDEKLEDSLNINNKSLSIRVPQDLGETNESQIKYG